MFPKGLWFPSDVRRFDTEVGSVPDAFPICLEEHSDQFRFVLNELLVLDHLENFILCGP